MPNRLLALSWEVRDNSYFKQERRHSHDSIDYYSWPNRCYIMLKHTHTHTHTHTEACTHAHTHPMHIRGKVEKSWRGRGGSPILPHKLRLILDYNIITLAYKHYIKYITFHICRHTISKPRVLIF